MNLPQKTVQKFDFLPLLHLRFGNFPFAGDGVGKPLVQWLGETVVAVASSDDAVMSRERRREMREERLRGTHAKVWARIAP